MQQSGRKRGYPSGSGSGRQQQQQHVAAPAAPPRAAAQPRARAAPQQPASGSEFLFADMMQAMRDSLASQPAPNQGVSRDGTCLYFLSGFCRMGEACRNRHGSAGGGRTARGGGAAPAPAHPRTTTRSSVSTTVDTWGAVAAAEAANKRRRVEGRRYSDVATRLGPKQQRDKRTEECCVCLENFNRPKTDPVCKTRACGHCFHQKCLTEWLRFGTCCPLCSTELFNEDEEE